MKNYIVPPRYFILAGQTRTAEDILRVEHKINPRHPKISIYTRIDSIFGIRNCPLMILDPHSLLPERSHWHLRIMVMEKLVREWTDDDFEYLRTITPY